MSVVWRTLHVSRWAFNSTHLHFTRWSVNNATEEKLIDETFRPVGGSRWSKRWIMNWADELYGVDSGTTTVTDAGAASTGNQPRVAHEPTQCELMEADRRTYAALCIAPWGAPVGASFAPLVRALDNVVVDYWVSSSSPPPRHRTGRRLCRNLCRATLAAATNNVNERATHGMYARASVANKHVWRCFCAQPSLLVRDMENNRCSWRPGMGQVIFRWT